MFVHVTVLFSNVEHHQLLVAMINPSQLAPSEVRLSLTKVYNMHKGDVAIIPRGLFRDGNDFYIGMFAVRAVFSSLSMFHSFFRYS
jgi:hypothetical protein